jgi:hypothetical protein
MPLNPWTFVGASTVVETTATGHTLTLPAGTQDGDLLVAVIASRIASTVSITLPSGWTRVTEQKTNNVVAGASTGIASCMMAYIVRGPSAPALGFTHPVAPSVAQGQIVAYRGAHPGTGAVPTLDASTSFTTATGVTAVSGVGLTSNDCIDLVVMGVAGGRAAAWSAFDAVTRPGTPSGTGGQTGAPVVGTWSERADTTTATGADTSLGIADGVMDIASATGNLTVTASLSGGHAVCAGAFRVGFGEIAQTGSTLRFANIANAASGTVSSTITVPADATMVAVGLSSFAATADWFTGMTFTKGGVDTPMVKVGSNSGGGWGGGLYYMLLPDTGANKTLKWSFAGTHQTNNLVTVTFWKGVGGIGNSSWQMNTGAPYSSTYTTVDNRMQLLYASAFCTASGTEGNVTQWVNGCKIEEVVHSLEADAAWGKAYVGAGSTVVGVNSEVGWDDGTCWMLELIPASQVVSGTMAETEDLDVAAMTGTVSDPATTIIVQTGTTLQFNPALANTGTVSTTITVPSDADFMLVGWSGTPTGGAGFFSSGNMKFPKGGTATNLTVVTTAADQGPSWAGPLFYMVAPDTGTNKTLTWDWMGTSAAGDSAKCSITFWKNVDQSNPVRAAVGGTKVTLPGSFGPLNASAGDLVVGWAGLWTGATAEQAVTAWIGGLSTLTQGTFNVNADFAWGTCAASGSIALVGVSTATNTAELGFTGVALRPATPVTGTMGEVEDADVAALTGAVAWSGPLAAPETADVLAATGTVQWVGTLAAPETVDVLAATGTVRWVATLTAPETVDVGAFTGSISWIVTLAAPESADTAAMTGTVFTPILAATEAADVGAFTATVRWAATLATTEAVDTAALTGAVAWSATLTTTEAGDSAAATGAVRWVASLAVSETVDVAALTGAVTWVATLATTELPDVAAFTGELATPPSGTLFVQEPADAAAFTGGIYASGPLGTVEAPDTASLTGTTSWSAILATTEAADVAALTGAVRWSGTLTTSEAPDTALLAGTVRWAATLTSVETADAGAFTGAVRWVATLAVTEAPDVAAFTGGIVGTGTLATTEAPDTYAGTITVFGEGINGPLAVVEPADAGAFTGQVTGVAGTLVTTEAPDTAALTGSVRWAAVWASTEAPDAAAFNVTARTIATLAASEAPDVAALTGTAQWIAALATTEAPDLAGFTGTTRWTATLATSEAPDVAAITMVAGALALDSTLATVEARDALASTGTVLSQIVLDVSEAPDDATFIVTFRSFGPLDATEAPDGALFTEAPISIQEADGLFLRNDKLRVRGLMGPGQRVRVLKYPMPRPRELLNTYIRKPKAFAGD